MAEKKPDVVVVPAQEDQKHEEPKQQPLQGKKLDEAPEGGRYLVNGVLVDANGQPVKDKQ